MKKTEFFKIEGDRITRIRKYCPKCGPAVFLAEHKDRFSCGNCGYTEFKGGSRPSKPPREEKHVEAKTEAPVKEPPQEKAPEPASEDHTDEEASVEKKSGEEIPKENDEKQTEEDKKD